MQKPQRESVEYRLRWVPNAKFSCWPCTFDVFCVDLFYLGVSTKPVSSGLVCLKVRDMGPFLVSSE